MENVTFRTAMRGFAKEDVMSYIEKMDRELTDVRAKLEKTSAEKTQLQQGASSGEDERVSGLEARVKELEEALQQLHEEYVKKEQEAAGLQTQLDEEKKQSQAYKSATEQLSQSLEQERKNAEDSTLTLQYQEKQISALQAKNQELLDQSSRSEDTSKQVGDVIIEAHRIANDIVKNAEERARTITVNAQLAVAKIASDISSFHTELDALSDALRTNTKAMQERLDAMTGAVETTQKTFVDRFSDNA